MRLIKNTTELIGIKDQNINISLVLKLILISRFKQNSIILHHHVLIAMKNDQVRLSKPSKIPLLEQAGTPTLLRLKKRRFQCKIVGESR